MIFRLRPGPAALLCIPLGIALSMAARLDGTRQASSTADRHVLVITSDSQRYCRALCEAIDAHGTLPRELTELRAQGEAMCRHGQVQGGLARLRRALLVLHDPREGPS